MRLAWLALLWPSVASADWPEANPARPSFSDNADVTATGAFEVEAGVATADEGDSGAMQWTLKYGVTDRFDVRVNLENPLWGDDLALTGAGLLLKLTLRKPIDRVLGLAVEPYVNLPSPSGGPEGFGGGLFLVGTYIRGRVQIDSCIVTDVATADDADTAITVSPIAAVGRPLVGPFGGYVEVGVDVPAAGGGSTNPYAGVGFEYIVTKFLVLDGAFYVGDEPRTQIFAGLTYSMYVPPHHHHL